GRGCEDAQPGQPEAWLQRGVDDGDRGGAVADAAGVAGGHGAAVAEGRAQPGEPLRGEGGTGAVVAHDVPEGHDLVVEAPRVAGGDGPGVRGGGVGVLAFPGDAGLLGE